MGAVMKWLVYVVLVVAAVAVMLAAPGSGENVQFGAEQCTPQQVHIAFGGSSKEVTIMWSTIGHCTTEVKYGTGPWELDQSSPGESRLFDDPVNKDGLQVLHRVSLKDLNPGTTYFYEAYSDKYSVGPYFFNTPTDDTSKPVEFMVVSDVNTSSPAIPALIKEALTGKYDAMLHAGNIAMGLGSANGKNGDLYMRLMEQAIRSVPYMTAPGPEEEINKGLQYLYRFSMPDSEWPMRPDKMWYSFDVGLVHVISYCTEVFYNDDANYASFQHDWLIKDLKLANANRASVPWVVAFGHRPMYCTYNDTELECNKKTSKLKQGLEDIFYHYGADLIIQSYGGAYERTYPMYKNVAVNMNYTNPFAPVHVVTGGATPWELEYNFTTPAPGWSAFRYGNVSVMTYGRLRILNATNAEYEEVNVGDGTVIDSFIIYQEKHGEFSTDKLPENISAKIDKETVDAGGKPGVLNIKEIGSTEKKSKLEELMNGDNRNRLIIGVSCGGFIILLLVIILVVKRVRRRKRVTRRWEQMDINYGKKFYSKAPDKDEDNDFEIDISDGTEPTRKLLNSGD